MKTFIVLCMGTAAVLSFSACTIVEESDHPTVTTTTTEETTIHRPVGATTETQVIRSY